MLKFLRIIAMSVRNSQNAKCIILTPSEMSSLRYKVMKETDNSDKFSLTLVAGKKKAIYLASSQGPCLITQASLDIKTS